MPTGAAGGRIIFNRGTFGTILEAEPNDTAGQAHVLGTLRATQRLTVAGSLGVDGDVFDGFQVRVPQRVRVTATLTLADPVGSSFDLALYDPVSMQFLEDFGSGAPPVTGTFIGKGAFDLVVRRMSGAGQYVLAVSADPAAAPVLEQEPNGTALTAQPLGEVVPGDVLTVAGSASASAPTDAVDAVLVTCPAAERLHVDLQMPAFQNFDVDVLDATGGLATATPLASFSSTTANPETGFVDVSAGTLLLVEVRAVAGSGAWTLSLRGAAPGTFTAAVVASAPRLVPLSREGDVLGVPLPKGTEFGRVATEFVNGEVLVGFEPGAEAEAAATVVARGGRVVETCPGGWLRVRFGESTSLAGEDAGRLTISRAAACLAPEVRFAQPNGIRHATTTTPNDPYYNLQWGLKRIRCPEAWDLTTGSASVIVAVIDTGSTDHPDLAGRFSGGYDFISDPSMSLDGGGLDADPRDPGDHDQAGGRSTFHGTHVAGIIGAASNNGLGVAGVAWNATIMPVRVLGHGGGTDSDIANGIRYASRLSNASGTLPPTRASVINMSIGGPGYSQVLADACKAAHDAGVVVIAAAGNDDTSMPEYPAANPYVISVMAVGYDLLRAPYSNFGSTVDLAAPGGNSTEDANSDGHDDRILSTLYDDSSGTPVVTYDWAEGTSMAAPHVAGVAALVLSINPSLTPDQVESILESTAKDLGAAGKDDVYGFGFVDAYEACKTALGTVLPPALSITPTSVVFSPTVSTQDVLVYNLGAGLLTIGTITPTTTSGGAWLSASAADGGDATATTRTIRLTVDRTGLVPGTYFGNVTVTSNGGTKVVLVLMDVAATIPPPPDVDIFVRAVNANTGAVVQQNSVNPLSSLTWTFTALPAGDYVFVAGSDFDHDGVLDEDGDYYGIYGQEGRATVVHVHSGDTVSNLDFSVSPVTKL